MKKRFVTTLIAFIACIACALGLAACDDADPVAGKTYVFDKIEITEGLKGELKKTTETQMNELFKDDYVKFGSDNQFTIAMAGTPVTGTYTQNGNKLTMTLNGTDQEAKISGDTVTMSGSQNGLSINMIYKFTATENGNENEGGNEGNGEEEGSEGNEEEGGISGDVLAGKTYVLTEYLMNGQSVFEQMSSQLGETKIVFGQNGDCTMISGTNGSMSGTYAISGNAVTITIENDPQNFTIAENTITATVTQNVENISMTLVMIFTLQA